jgi:ABC-type hemin transport system substrate-binding protein
MYIKKYILLFVFLVFTLFCCTSCEENEQQDTAWEPYPISIGNLTLYSEPDTLLPMSDEIASVLIDLGYQDKIIGICSQTTLESLNELPEAGTSSNPDFDAIVSLNPELVITDTALSTSQMNILSENNIKILVLTGSSSQYPTILSKISGNPPESDNISEKTN